ncbi:uncharacterized protein [Antedon mediterranea]|uniref:uncharacterized protein n=1 Tax=Antedon mediterranea TaxID=105859 RepID=UPI003AF94FC9
MQFVCKLGPRKAGAIIKTLKQENQRLENWIQLGQVIQIARRCPHGGELDNANPVRKDDTGLCPFCLQDDFPELSEGHNLKLAKNVENDVEVEGQSFDGTLTDTMLYNCTSRVCSFFSNSTNLCQGR